MVGLSDLFWAYQNSGPALLLFLLVGGGYVWRHDIQPRLDALESTQEDRGDRWQDQTLNAQERAMLIDDAHNRIDDVDETMDRLKARVRSIEQAHAVEHGEAPSADFVRCHDHTNSDPNGGDA